MIDDKNNKSKFNFKSIYFLYILLIGVGIYLIIYHGPHLWTILPLLIFLSCPLMHLFHHSRHGKHEKSEHENKQENKNNDKQKGCH
jgi:hypothetical protein